MKALRTVGLAGLLTLLLAGTSMAAQPQVGLGSATSFAVLAGATITNTGPTTITGNVGLHPGTSVTGFGSVTLHGTLHKADGSALRAKRSLTSAYVSARGRTPVSTIPTELGGRTLRPGVYRTSAGTLGLTGRLVLDGRGDRNAVFIFQAASTLVTASNSRVSLINGAQACNVFWRVGSSATLGTGTRFAGNILASSSITFTTNARLIGRAFARNGAVTLDTNVITRPSCSAGSLVPQTDVAAISSTPGGGTSLPIVASLMAVLVIAFLGSFYRMRGARRRAADGAVEVAAPA